MGYFLFERCFCRENELLRHLVYDACHLDHLTHLPLFCVRHIEQTCLNFILDFYVTAIIIYVMNYLVGVGERELNSEIVLYFPFLSHQFCFSLVKTTFKWSNTKILDL